MDAIEQFKDAMLARDITPPGFIEADGKLHRFPTNGKDDSGWYVFHDDGIPAGAFGDWRTGLSETWRADTGRELTPGERAAHRARMDAMSREREAEDAKRKREARERAAAIWEAAKQAPDDHSYLTRKGVKACGLRVHEGVLVIPMRDGEELHSLQFIGQDGDKRFLSGGRVSGCSLLIGKAPDAPDGVLCIAEGYATGASIREATGYAVAVAFNAGNLLAVARALRSKYPEVKLILCADDDYATQGNPGLTKAREAARAVGALLSVPAFGEDRPEGATDFNDLARHRGLEAVGRAVEGGKVRGKVEAHAESAKLQVIDLHDLLRMEIPPRDLILSPWLPTQSLSMIYSWRGVGKTYLALWLAYSVAATGRFLTWFADTPRSVLFIDGEMPLVALQNRLAKIIEACEPEAAPGTLRFITPDIQRDAAMPDLADPKGQAAVDELADGAELIVIDNISALVRGNGRENEAESWVEVQEWALAKRAQGKSVLFIHHSGKAGAQRGTSKREDLLDTVIALRHPPDYSPEDGAVFEIHYEKARGLHGESVKPIEAKLAEDEHGLQAWTWVNLEESTYKRVVALAAVGLTQKDIAAELGITKSSVSRAWKKGVANGDIKAGKQHGRNQYSAAKGRDYD